MSPGYWGPHFRWGGDKGVRGSQGQRFLVTSGFSLASQSKTVTKGEDARRENPKGNKEIWESREMS